ncbi:tetratricopeptide repeat protein [Falsiroseomonas sp. HW251]|uniref:tetratricopeptide repeat protein n=1 Tax=Falsiroseomonas sp. HW251 TaxID=3390998 RepID=UPI003D3109B2
MTGGDGSARPDLVLHIGQWKTGTTSIQRILGARREELAALGVRYPRSPGHANHQLLPASLVPAERLQNIHPATWEGMEPAARLARFRAEFAEEMAGLPTGTRLVVISAEQLAGMLVEEAEIAALRSLVAPFFGRIRVAMYLRRQDQHYESSYAQRLRVGDLRPPRFPDGGPEVLVEYDYARTLGLWAAVFGEAAVEPRLYEPQSLRGGDIVEDFLVQYGIPLEVPADDPHRRSNPSLAPEAIDLVRILGARIEQEQGALDGDSPLWCRMIQAVDEALPGRGWKPPPAEAAAFLARFEAVNEAVRRRWFPDRPSLFSDPPRAEPGMLPPATPPPPDPAAALEAACALIARETASRMASEAHLHAQIARLRERLDEPENALNAWRAVLRNDPTHPVAIARMAEAAHRSGREQEALDHLGRLRQLHPGHALVARLTRMLARPASQTVISAGPASPPATR